MKSISSDAFTETLRILNEDPEGTKKSSFESALDGIRKGEMNYQIDPVLPILKDQIIARTTKYRNMSQEEESAILSLSQDQKVSVSKTDRS